MRKRKLYLSELIGKYIPKSYQFIAIYDEKLNKRIYYENSLASACKGNIPIELLDRQVKSWEVLHSTDIYIYI